MNENDNKRDYSDFFKAKPEGQDREGEAREQSDVARGAEDKPSYHYSYGPNKSSSSSEPATGSESTSYTSTTSGNSGNVEVSPPRPLRPFGYTDGDAEGRGGVGGWQPPQRPRSSLRSIFSAFMAGALVVGVLMFAADKTNMFTGGNHPLASSAPTQTPNASGSGAAPTTAALDVARPNSVSSIAKQAGPAVVKVETLVKAKANARGGNSLFNDPMFRQFFGDMFGDGAAPQQQQPGQDGNGLQPSGMGTGFIFEKSGYILTNEHVVDGADQIHVYIQGYDKPFTAKLLGSSYDLDLAVLKIEGTQDFPTLPIGNSDNTQVGDWVVAIGNPYDFDYTVTVGVLSAKERPISIPDQKGTRSYKHLFQTDAAINPGNSGGPLLNLNGEVIGINTAVSAQAQGIGFAIPTSTVSQVLDNLKNNVKIPKEPLPYIGVAVGDIPKDYLSDLKLDSTDGALVLDVPRKTPAFSAGMRQYDVITAINGQKVTSKDDLTKKVQAAKVGDKLTISIVRNGAKQDVTVTVGDRNQNSDLNPQQ